MFDIAQFFSSLNHKLLLLILNKAKFNIRISHFFSNYLINKQTQYIYNNFILSSFKVDVSMRQRLALSPILLAFYIAFLFYIVRKKLKICLFLFLFLFFLLLTIVFLFFKKRVTKNQT